MKLIKAYIQPRKLQELTLALEKTEGVTGMSYMRIEGCGHTRLRHIRHGDTREAADFVQHIEMELICADEHVESIISVIRQVAHTGLAGDGAIFVLPVETGVRIASGEQGAMRCNLPEFPDG